MRAKLVLPALLLSLAALAAPAHATIDAHSDGSDGALNVTSADLTIDLSQAVTGSWDQAGNGKGVYDPSKWAIVFKYSSINIASGRTVRFTNHPSNAPVVWLVQGVATIAGSVVLDGEAGNSQNRETVPGPGGFPGGRGGYTGSPSTPGHGPGGAQTLGSGFNGSPVSMSGAYSTASNAVSATYGNERLLPLMGGSGAGGANNIPYSGGAGGGALLLSAGQRVTLTGGIYARGGSAGYSGCCTPTGEGSGGGIRVVTDSLTGNGVLNATGMNGYGGQGRVRLEANVLTLSTQSAPAYSLLRPLTVEGAVIWPPAPEPTLRFATVNGVAVTSDPRMNPEALVSGDLTVSGTTLIPYTLEAFNLPTNSTVNVRVGLGGGGGTNGVMTSSASFSSGDGTHSFWSGTLTILSAARVTSLQAKAVLP